MKIPASIRSIYDEQKSKNDRLKLKVDALLNQLKDARWHYESRVKGLESFALKIESGRYPKPDSLEDFFACTLVVANASEINRAEQLVKRYFKVKYRRPIHKIKTTKKSDAFPFDDLRLFVTILKTESLPPSDLSGIVFEIQIKTFLQHAWSIATHDLVYKTDDVNWAKERIAYQTKAMLEHAEISIQEAERLARCSFLKKEDRGTEEINCVIGLLKRQWGLSELPSDIRRLAQNFLQLFAEIKIDIHRVEEILESGKRNGGGKHPLNLSPFSTLVKYLFDFEKGKMHKLLLQEGLQNGVLIPKEVEIPADIDRSALRNSIFV